MSASAASARFVRSLVEPSVSGEIIDASSVSGSSAEMIAERVVSSVKSILFVKILTPSLMAF